MPTACCCGNRCALVCRALRATGAACLSTAPSVYLAAGMLVLCRRASYEAEEMSPQLLLTCLWWGGGLEDVV